MIKRILFILVLMLMVLTPFVSAETLTGELGLSGWNSTNYAFTPVHYVGWPGAVSQAAPTHIYINGFEYSGSFESMIYFNSMGCDGAGGGINVYDANAPSGGQTPVTFRMTDINGRIVGTGRIGYQRYFNQAVPPVEQLGGYFYVEADSWNLSTETGAKSIYLDYNHSAVYNMSFRANDGNMYSPPSGKGSMRSGGFQGGGAYTWNKATDIWASYSATKPLGLGIQGSVNKTALGGSTYYNSRAYILNSTGSVITSDTTTNPTAFFFNVPNDRIIIAILSPELSWFNSSVLFSAGGGLPTPTPTQIPGGTPADMSNITIAVKYVLNDTAVGTAYVELQSYLKAANHNDPNAWQSSLQGYTDPTTGYFQSDMTTITGYDFKVIVQKPGFQTTTEWITPSPYYYARIIYLYADTTGSGGIPTTINYTLQIKNSQTGANVVGALVTLKDTIAGTAQRSVLSNATGYAVFKGVPNTAYIDGSISATNYQTRTWSIEIDSSTGTYIQSKDYARSLYISPVGVSPTGTVTPYPTPTPTPIASDSLILTATPDSINLGSSVSLVGSSSNVTRLTYAGGLRRTSFYVNMHPRTYPFDYNMIGTFENVNATYWKFRPNNSASWGADSTTSPLTLVNTPNANGLITYSFNAYDTNGAIATAGTDDVLVGGGAGSGALTIAVGAYDATTTGRLMDFSLNITDEGSGVVTEYGNINYMKEITLPRGNGYVLRTTKEGYQTSTTIGESGTRLIVVPTSLSIQKGDYGAVFNVPMFPDGAITVGNTSISVRVFDIETYYPLSGVQVTNSYAPTDIKYTGEEDSLTWTMPQNTAYTLTAFKSGYCTITQSKNTSTNTHQFVPLYLKYGSCSGATATPTPTPTITPTATPIGGWGNVTGGASVCGILPDDATIIDILKNSMACNGLKDTQSQNLGMSMLIILFAAIILGRIAKGVGVLAGAIIGTVISTVAGFLPFWIIIVVIIMAGLVFAGKVFWSSSQ